jgi:pilus assembly protein CpaF
MFNTVKQQEQAADSGTVDQRHLALKRELHARLVAGIDGAAIGNLDDETLREEMRRGAEQLCSEHADLISGTERRLLIDEIVDEALGLGPLEALLRDSTVSDIMINGPNTVFVERRGRLEPSETSFRDDDHLVDIVQRIAGRVGRRVDESSPLVDARLEDGSRLNAVIRPVALDGALISIRRFPERPLMAADLIANKSATPEIIEFLTGCVRARMNIVVAGGTGSGKTTLLNMLSGHIPHSERVVTIEDAAELRLQQPHVARMETRPANVEGKGEITARDLVRNALRMRPDRVIVGECRAGEAFDMLQAMNTGHDGSLTTIHANDARDAISRLEMLVGMAGYDLPIWIIQRQIASAIDIVVHAARLSGGHRTITQVSEITGVQNNVVSMHDIFEFEQTGVSADGMAQGEFRATGIVPHCLQRLTAAGIPLPASIFERRKLLTV